MNWRAPLRQSLGLLGPAYGTTKRFAAVQCRIAQVNDDVGDGVQNLPIAFPGHLEFPVRNGAGAFEGQVAFVTEIQLKQATVIDAPGNNNLLRSPPIRTH